MRLSEKDALELDKKVKAEVSNKYGRVDINV